MGADVVSLDKPVLRTDRPFLDVLESRNSKVGGRISWSGVSELLWYACRTRQHGGLGRSGIEIEHRVMPSAGGLHSVAVVCQMISSEDAPRLYLPGRHAFAILDAAHADAGETNQRDVVEMTGATSGCTLRLIADFQKVGAAYHNPESLIWCDAGAIIATLCLVAEWLNLDCVPLGLAGSLHLPRLGYPRDRFIGTGAVHIGG